jgi:hypothetical protein
VRVVCDHCGNAVFSSWGNTGIVDEMAKRIGWRRDSPTTPVRSFRVLRVLQRRPRVDRDEVDEVAAEFRDLGVDVDDAEVADWLAEYAELSADDVPHAPAGLDAAVDWLERAEASQTPIRPDILDRLAPGTNMRGDIAWQRTAEGLLACSGHCFEQLSFCLTCNLPRTAPTHRSCSSYVPPCTEHSAEILPFPRPPDRK